MKRPFAGVALGLVLQPLVALAASEPATHQFTLDNGLKVIVHEDHRAGVVNSQLWFHVGASHEPPGQSGMSHALEHMIFQGSSKLCPGESAGIYRKLGASENATTLNGATIIYQTLAPQALGVAFEVMADQMSTAHLSPSQWTTEREIIKSERSESVDNLPRQRALERARRVAFMASAAGNPVIGWRHDIERMQIEELQHWYRRWYAPNNATLVVVGDIRLEQVKALATRYFGSIEPRELPVAKTPLELATPGERSITQYLDHQIPTLSMTFNVPSLITQTDPRTALALTLLSEMLAGSSGAVINTKLVRGDELLVGASTHYNSISRGDELFTLTALLNIKKTTSMSEVKQRLWRELEALKNAPPSPEDLDRARTRLIAQDVFNRDDLTRYAAYLGKLNNVGLSWEQDEERQQTLKAITPEDIQRTAQTYFTRDRLTTGYIVAAQANHE